MIDRLTAPYSTSSNSNGHERVYIPKDNLKVLYTVLASIVILIEIMTLSPSKDFIVWAYNIIFAFTLLIGVVAMKLISDSVSHNPPRGLFEAFGFYGMKLFPLVMLIIPVSILSMVHTMYYKKYILPRKEHLQDYNTLMGLSTILIIIQSFILFESYYSSVITGESDQSCNSVTKGGLNIILGIGNTLIAGLIWREFAFYMVDG